jgi:hypothetical protein
MKIERSKTNAHHMYLGHGTPGHTQSVGVLEVDGMAYFDGGATIGGEVGYGAESDLTISAGGAVAVTQVYHSIIVTGGTGSGADDLSTATGGAEGQILILKANTSGANDQVTVKDGTGANTFICAGGADFILDHVDDRIMFIHNGTEWVELSRSSNS